MTESQEYFPHKTMEMNLNCEPDLMELTATNPETREVIVAYIRNHTTTIVKELDGEALRAITFGTGPLQSFREMYLRADPPDKDKIFQNLYGGIICSSD